MGDRRGRGQILSATQLAERLAIPCYYILMGRAQAAFPETSTPGPSSFVQVVRTGGLLRPSDVSAFPVTVNWRQWKDVVVPILEDERWVHYTGNLGGSIAPNNFGIPGLSLGSGLYEGLVPDFLDLLGLALVGQGIDQGYGSPGQVC
jgi:hypothetical protein